MNKKWSANEIALLKKLYPITDNVEILKHFPERSFESIKIKAKRLKIYRNCDIKKKIKVLPLLVKKMECTVKLQ